ncbi:MAG: hypothetical protein KC414_15200, partial [Romboutsia sp.]|nr:hypothetical protein [Romboutsia sp.]
MKSERSSKVLETIHQGTQSLLQSLSNSYGPKGLDKMLIQGKETVITNDGATILSFFKTHPIHKILSELSSSQDLNCGDGTTSVVILACSIFDQLKKLKDS